MTHPATALAQARAESAARAIFSATGVEHHEIAFVLGSGWSGAADAIGTTIAQISTSQLPHFAAPAVPGHEGIVRSVDADGRRALVFLGRTHLYEDHGVDAVTHAVRTAAATGVKVIVLTNGAGSLLAENSPGTAVLIGDHLNLTGTSPLHGPEFVDLTTVYSARLRDLCRSVDPQMPEGVYAQVRGPMYETPAEIVMIRNAGGTLVGMSTALEAIVARSLGLEVLGLSLVTNLASGMSGGPIHHGEVLDAGQQAASRLGPLLSTIARQA